MYLTIEKMMILKSVEIFANTSQKVLEDVVPVLIEEHYSEGKLVYAKDTMDNAMYIIAKGRVKVHDGDTVVTELGEREIFGELSAIDPEPRSMSITTLEHTVLLKLSQIALSELLADRFEIAEGFFKVLCQRIRRRNIEK